MIFFLLHFLSVGVLSDYLLTTPQQQMYVPPQQPYTPPQQHGYPSPQAQQVVSLPSLFPFVILSFLFIRSSSLLLFLFPSYSSPFSLFLLSHLSSHSLSCSSILLRKPTHRANKYVSLSLSFSIFLCLSTIFSTIYYLSLPHLYIHLSLSLPAISVSPPIFSLTFSLYFVDTPNSTLHLTPATPFPCIWRLRRWRTSCYDYECTYSIITMRNIKNINT